MLLIDDLKRANLMLSSKRLQRAYGLTEELYNGQVHWTRQPLLEHVTGMLRILMPFQPDEDTIIACLLQYVLDTGKMTLVEVEEEFGLNVRLLISGVHLLSHVTLRDRRSSIEDLRLMILTLSDDIRVVFTILCERCYVLEYLAELHHDEKRQIAHDVLSLFAPVAARLGIYTLKQRLERVAFPIAYQEEHAQIAGQLDVVHRQYPPFLDESARLLKHDLQNEGIHARVEGREKQAYSIFLKMKSKTFSHIDGMHDLFALRVIVQNVEDCYRVLGVSHRLGHPVANRFKDYIAFPKPNGYQSLHTTVTRLPGIPSGIFVEVQIRTEQMHQEAEFGIAAHWKYKQGAGAADRMAEWVQAHKVISDQSVLHAGEQSSFTDNIFVLTPKGMIVELPEGATPLDFAFQIHTDMGLFFRAAKVNGSIVSLDYRLENGDVVEIIKHKHPQPSPEWMQLLRMASSRARLKRYLYSLDRSHHVATGRIQMNAELAKVGLPVLDADLTLLKFYDGSALSVDERQDLLLKIGQGSERASRVLPHLDRFRAVRKSVEHVVAVVRKQRFQRKDAVVGMEGGVPMPLRYAQCCRPSQGDHGSIVGFINRAGEVMIHRDACRMCRNANPSRKIDVWWK